jgi:outer membrane biosynthesis protein TonB
VKDNRNRRQSARINYKVPFFISIAFLVVLLGYNVKKVIIKDDTPTTLEFLDVIAPSAGPVHNASGFSNNSGTPEASKEEDAGTSGSDILDAAFTDGIEVPKPVGGLKKVFPIMARESNVEALVRILMVISPTGRVTNIQVLGVRLKRDVPGDLNRALKKEFARSAVLTVKNARYTIPRYKGKAVSVRIEETLNFTLH